MTSTSSAAPVAAVLLQCIVGLILVMTSLVAASQENSSPVNGLSPTLQPPAHISPLRPSGGDVIVTSPIISGLQFEPDETGAKSMMSPTQPGSGETTTHRLERLQSSTTTTKETAVVRVAKQVPHQTDDGIGRHSAASPDILPRNNDDAIYNYQDATSDDSYYNGGGRTDGDDDYGDEYAAETGAEYEYDENPDGTPSSYDYADYNVQHDDANNQSETYTGGDSVRYYGGGSSYYNGARRDGGTTGDLKRFDVNVHLVRDLSSDDSSWHRLITSNGLSTRTQPINMSLLVIYSWLAIVAVMIIVTVLFYKYKDPLTNLRRSIHAALCNRNKRSRGIEESNTLLTHPLV